MNKTILVINDNKPMRFLLQTIFNRKYKVTTVPNAFTAMHELSRDVEVEAIIVDLDSSADETWNFIHHIGSSNLYGNIPVIVLGSADDDTARIRCMELGVIKYFTKPFHPINLIETVDTLMGSIDLNGVSRSAV